MSYVTMARRGGMRRAARWFPAVALAAATVSAAFGQAGDAKSIFVKRCTGCHTYGRGVKVGPDLKGVTTRRERAWMVKFIQSSSKMISSGDPTAVALYTRFKKERMPDWTELTTQQVNALIDYFAADGPLQKSPDERNGLSATAMEVEAGRQIFHGVSAIRSGARACSTCHVVSGAGLAHAGELGPNLSTTYARFGDRALTDFLKRPCSLAAAAPSPYLTPQESFCLKAYLASTAAHAVGAVHSGSRQSGGLE